MANSRIDVPMSMGVNLLADPRKIQDTELVYAKNLVPVQPGILALRGAAGDVFVPLTSAPVAGDGVPLAMQVIPFSALADCIAFFRRANDTVEGKVVSNTTMTAFNYGDPTALVESSFGCVTQYQPSVLCWQNQVWVVGGFGADSTGKVLQLLPSGGGALEIINWSFAGTGNEALRPHIIGQYHERFIWANFGPGYESYAVMGDPGEPDVIGNDALLDNGRNFIIGDQNDGDRIVAIAEITQSAVGNPTNSACLFLKQYSAFIGTGEPNKSTDGDLVIGDFTISKITYDCGCASAKTLVKTPYGWIWAGTDDVWLFATGALPVRIGTKLRPKLVNAPASSRYLWHAEYHNGFYRLAIPSDGQVPLDDDPMGEQWWLDLRDGPPQNYQEARWWGPQVFNIPLYGSDDAVGIPGTHCMAQESKPNQNRRLYGLRGCASEGVSVIEYDVRESQDCKTHYERPLENTANEFEIHTKIYDFGDPFIQKIFQGGNLDIYTSENTQLEWTLLLDDGRQVTTDNWIDLRAKSGIITGVDDVDIAIFSREFQSVALHPLTDFRYQGKLVQLKVKSNAGFYIIEDVNDELLFGISPTGIADPTDLAESISIAAGFYANRTDLLAEIVTKVNTYLSGISGGTITFAPDYTSGILSIQSSLPGAYIGLVAGDSGTTASNALLALLGFSPITSTQAPFSYLISGENAVPYTQTPMVEIGGLVLKVRPMGRRPT